MSGQGKTYIDVGQDTGRSCIRHIIEELFLVPDGHTCLGSNTIILDDGELVIEGDGEFFVLSI